MSLIFTVGALIFLLSSIDFLIFTIMNLFYNREADISIRRIFVDIHLDRLLYNVCTPDTKLRSARACLIGQFD